VKYAARIYNKGTRYQPRIDGVVRDQSAHTTYTGKDAGLKEMYTSLVEAEKDLKRITELNISGYYAICFVK
jgi:hypothetical protein